MTREFESLGHETPTRDLEALRELARTAYRNASTAHPDGAVYALEVGAWTGRTALVLAAAVDRVYLVDDFRGNATDRLGPLAEGYGPERIFQALCRNLGDRLGHTVFPCIGRSRMWAEVWRTPLDLVFLDASHAYGDVREDILSWRPHVRKGGILCGHDYGVFDGVTRAVDDLLPHRRLSGFSIWSVEPA